MYGGYVMPKTTRTKSMIVIIIPMKSASTPRAFWDEPVLGEEEDGYYNIFDKLFRHLSKD